MCERQRLIKIHDDDDDDDVIKIKYNRKQLLLEKKIQKVVIKCFYIELNLRSFVIRKFRREI